MPAVILDGSKIAAQIRAEVGEEVKQLTAEGLRPGLAVVLVGHNPASEIYVRSKVRACEELGILSEKIAPPESSTTEELLVLVDKLNRRDDIDGILVQLPLPVHVDSKKVLLAVSPDKDVDGFHPMNVGNLSTQRPGLVPCTPAGVIEILKRSNIPIAGAEAVVVGRSDIVGKPVAMLLLNGNATVTVCHSKTRDLPAVCRRADILVAAIGRTGMITPEYVKPGATVIDVGMNKLTDPAEFQKFFAGDAKREQSFAKNGSTLIGDVHPKVAEIAGALTPVPGGVGPLTIAMLMSNTVKAAKLRRGQRVPTAIAR
jgi:methylenetetrahydrofolate dehydrogenase (NADP+)/methenyltetrahydrofolate cyclohydrolase